MIRSKRHSLLPLLAGLLGLLASVADAGPSSSRPKRLYGVVFQPSVELAVKKASVADVRKAKPIVWLRMLGDLEGKT